LWRKRKSSLVSHQEFSALIPPSTDPISMIKTLLTMKLNASMMVRIDTIAPLAEIGG
jgi:hypothetical protein